LVGKPEGKKPLGRPRRRLDDNIKMYLKEIEWEVMNWSQVAQDRDRWQAVLKLLSAIKCREFID
jgi:hypothetical protein